MTRAFLANVRDMLGIALAVVCLCAAIGVLF